MPIIQTHGLTRRFGGTEAVHDLNLAVPGGSVFALLGANGAGKTTALKMIMNFLPPTSGRSEVFGVDLRRLGERLPRMDGWAAGGGAGRLDHGYRTEAVFP